MALPHGLRALASPHFRLYLAGQGTSQIGNWVQLITTSWLIYRLTGSSWMMGLAAFAQHVPFLIIAPIAGVLIDRFDLRRMLIATNVLASLQACCMFVLVATGTIEAWHLVAGNLVLGIVNSCDQPGRQSLLVHLVSRRDHLPNAIALNSTMVNVARFIGPTIGGVIIAAFGETWGFALNSVLRLAVVAALLMVHVTARATASPAGGWFGQMRAGMRYAYGFLPSRSVLMLLAVTSIVSQGYQPLLPWFATQRLHGDSHTLGMLLGSAGLGALTGMIFLLRRKSVRGLFRLVGWTAALAGGGLMLFASTSSIWLAMPMLYLTGMGTMLTAVSTNTVLQTIVPDELRGRVASLYALSLFGMSPIGALAGGWAADRIGYPPTLMLFGSLALSAAGVYAWNFGALRRAIRPVYEQLGINRSNTGEPPGPPA